MPKEITEFELRPCPACGARPWLVYTKHFHSRKYLGCLTMLDKKYFAFRCNCGKSPDAYYKNIGEAIDAWEFEAIYRQKFRVKT